MTFGIVRYDWDEFRSWDYRYTLHGGLGYRVIDTEARKGRDVSIADVIDTTSTWTSHLDNYLTLVQGGEIATLSILDFANGEADGDTFQLLRGYGSLGHEFGQGLPVALGSAGATPTAGVDGPASGTPTLPTVLVAAASCST